MDAKEYLNTHYYGIDVNVNKPILITVEQLLEIMNNFKKKNDEKIYLPIKNRNKR